MTTSNDLKQAILTHLRAYRDKEAAVTNVYWETDVQIASYAQQQLGYNAFAEGLIVHGWKAAQTRYLEAAEAKLDPGRWTSEMIKRMWMMCSDLWESRNAQIHRVATTREEVIIAHLDKEIQECHEIGHANQFLTRMETEFFNQPITELLKKTEYQKRAWLHAARKYIESDRKRLEGNKSRQILQEFLQPGTVRRTLNDRKNNTERTIGPRRNPSGGRHGGHTDH